MTLDDAKDKDKLSLSQEVVDSEAILKSRGLRDELVLHTGSQRKINMIWEITQAWIAIAVVGANIVAMFYLANPSEMMGNAFFLVIGFYFGRTNHERQGGVEVGYKGR